MTASVLLVAAVVAQAAGPADAITFRDGRVLLGQVVEAAPRRPVRVAVRRAWLQRNLPDRAAAWEKAEGATARRARDQRRSRLEAWRRERPADPMDRLGAWIDAELARLRDPGDAPAPLLLVEIAPTQIRRLDRRPEEAARLLRQAWRAGLDDPETRPLDDLRRALEGRGFALSDVDPAPITDLMALPLESDATWLARRAATEVQNDRGLRFIQYQGLILPEDAQAGPGPLAAAAAATLRGLLGDGDLPPDDGLAAKLQEIESRGQVGLVLTRLDLGGGLDSATVTSALLVRLAPGRWAPAVVRPVTVRAGEVPPDAAAPVVNDPQVKALFGLVQGLGLGDVGQEIQKQSTGVGAAARQALGQSRSALSRELDALALPVGR